MMGSIGLERASSIELEPLTLSFAELQLAREAAMYILKNNPLEDAIKIFTEGLHTVPMMSSDSVRLSEGSEEHDEEEEEEDDDDDDDDDDDEIAVMMDCVGLHDRQFFGSHGSCFRLRETVTAPF